MSAYAMIERCFARQQGDGADISTSRGCEMANTPLEMSVGDAGIEGHAPQRTQHEDTRDDGTPLVGPGM